MPDESRPPGDEELAEMHRILLKVAGREMPTPEELAFLREIRIEVLERFSGPSMRVDLRDDEPA
jgi:hypothetical protein